MSHPCCTLNAITVVLVGGTVAHHVLTGPRKVVQVAYARTHLVQGQLGQQRARQLVRSYRDDDLIRQQHAAICV